MAITVGVGQFDLTWRRRPLVTPPQGVAKNVMREWAIDFFARNTIEHQKKFEGVTTGQMAAGITKMYADYRNQQIPIHALFDVVAESIKGASEREIETRLIEIRKEVAERGPAPK